MYIELKDINRSKSTTYKKRSTNNQHDISSFNCYSNYSDPRLCVYCTVCKKTVDEVNKCYVSGITFPKNAKVVSLQKAMCSRCRMAL